MKKDGAMAQAIEKKKRMVKLDKDKLLKAKKKQIKDSKNEILK